MKKELSKMIYLYAFPFIFFILLNRFYHIRLSIMNFNSHYDYNIVIFMIFSFIGIAFFIWYALLLSLSLKKQSLVVGFFLSVLILVVFLLYVFPHIYPTIMFYSILESLSCIYLIMGCLFTNLIYLLIKIYHSSSEVH